MDCAESASSVRTDQGAYRTAFKVFDVGCGTGRFAFSLADKCGCVLGIDLSQRNIERANRNLSSNPDPRVSFEHRSVRETASEGKLHFDYAVLTYVLHEVAEHERAELLQDISQVADRIILGDYRVPRPSGVLSAFNEIVEFAASRDHYTNVKSFVANGGIRRLIEAGHFEVIEDVPNSPHTSILVMLRSPRG